MICCPRCGAAGRAVSRHTLTAQVPTAALVATELDGWRLCPTGDCAVVYTREGAVFGLDAVAATPFHKSADPARLVCFCFGHTVEAVEEDARVHGRSTVCESVQAACGAGQDDCERKNPQGRCCLGDIGRLVKAIGATAEPEAETCCAPRDTGCCGPKAADSGPVG